MSHRPYILAGNHFPTVSDDLCWEGAKNVEWLFFHLAFLLTEGWLGRLWLHSQGHLKHHLKSSFNFEARDPYRPGIHRGLEQDNPVYSVKKETQL